MTQGSILAYADDIDIIGQRLSYVADAYQGIEQAAESLGLQINEAKTKLMVATSAGLPINNQNLCRRDVQIGERTFEVVPEFTYLGSKVSNDNSMEAELRARMLAANRSFYSLKNQFTSNNQSRRTKLGLYCTYIVPVLTYASEKGCFFSFFFHWSRLTQAHVIGIKLQMKTDVWWSDGVGRIKLTL